MNKTVHYLPDELLERPVRVAVIGAGGSGAQMVTLLARLHLAMIARGHPGGLQVIVIDDAIVREANLGRQVWSPADVGLPKAAVVVHRINTYYGLNWQSACTRLSNDTRNLDVDILIGCVDTRGARRQIHDLCKNKYAVRHYWLDLGNASDTAQVVLGQVRARDESQRLPWVTELFPELLDESVPDDDRHSCSIALSLQSQGLLVNDFASRIAGQLLYDLFSAGELKHHGAVLNLASMMMMPLKVDPQAWGEMRATNEPAAELETA